jgi:hypothetical protein
MKKANVYIYLVINIFYRIKENWEKLYKCKLKKNKDKIKSKEKLNIKSLVIRLMQLFKSKLWKNY